MIARVRSFGLAAALLLAGCGAGGSAPSAPFPAAPAVVPSAVLPAPAPSANGSANVTIVYPTGFRTAKAPSSAGRAATYVNPTSGGKLHVFVAGSEVNGSPFTVNALPNGTQQLSVPATAGASPQSLAITEKDAADSLVLAQGSGSFTLATPGASASVTLTMSIDAQRVAITTDNVAGSDAQALGSGVPNPTPFCTSNATLYPFAADPSLGFVLPGVQAGNVSGVPAPTLLSQTPDGGTSSLGAPSAGAYPIAFDGASTGFTAVFAVTNPSGLAVLYPNGSYPGQYVGSAYIYKICTPAASASPTTFAVGNSSTVTVTGGAPPFTMHVGAPCASAPAGSRAFTMSASATGSCSYYVTDNAGRSSTTGTLTLTTGPLTVSCTTCTGLANGPSPYNLGIYEAGYASGTYTLSGSGTGCFFSPSSTVTATSGNATVHVTGNPQGGTCTMTVTDSSSSSVTSSMTFAAASNPSVSNSSSLPSIPSGLKATTLSGPLTPYPIVVWGGYYYYPWSYLDNRNAYGLQTYDGLGNQVTCSQITGDRYINTISVNVGTSTVTFSGQITPVTASFASLVPPGTGC